MPSLIFSDQSELHYNKIKHTVFCIPLSTIIIHCWHHRLYTAFESSTDEQLSCLLAGVKICWKEIIIVYIKFQNRSFVDFVDIHSIMKPFLQSYLCIRYVVGCKRIHYKAFSPNVP